MTTPPHKLLEHLWQRESIMIQGAGKPEFATITRAMALAERGLVEGVGPRPGAIKYLRWLPASAQPDRAIAHPQRPQAEETYKSRSGCVVARTNMGVYREFLPLATVSRDSKDRPVVVAEGELTGNWTFTFCCHRAGDGRPGVTIPESTRKPDLETQELAAR